MSGDDSRSPRRTFLPTRWSAASRAAGDRLRFARYLRLAGARGGLMLALQVVAALGPGAVALAAGFAVSQTGTAVVAGRLTTAVPALLLLAGIFTSVQALESVDRGLSTEVRLRIDGQVRRRVRAAAVAVPDLITLADPAVRHDLERASELGHDVGRVRSVGAAVVGRCRLLARLAGGFTAIVILIHFSVLAAAVAVLLVAVNRAIVRREWMHLVQVEDSRIDQRRQFEHWSALALDGRRASEVRLFGMSPWIRMRSRRSLVAQRGPVTRDLLAVMRQQAVVVTLTLAAALVIVLPVTLAAAGGDLAAHEVVTILVAVPAVLRLAALGPEAFDIEFGRVSARALDRLSQTVGPPNRPPEAVADDGVLIELDQVSFHYPGRDAPILQRCDLRVGRDEVLGIVGLNGAGKTTLVKMLSGLIEPDRGTVRYPAGRPVAGAAIFHDFIRYPLTLRDNVAISAPEVRIDDEAVRTALGQAGLGDLEADLGGGLDGVLSRDLPDGTDLSGGQWQRIAIARTLYAAAAGRRLVVMDEPTANLDVRAEASFHREVLKALPGASVVLVSHRLSTVRHADRIVLVADGRVVESGTHDGLLARGGEYARLFALQADRFEGGAS